MSDLRRYTSATLAPAYHPWPNVGWWSDVCISILAGLALAFHPWSNIGFWSDVHISILASLALAYQPWSDVGCWSDLGIGRLAGLVLAYQPLCCNLICWKQFVFEIQLSTTAVQQVRKVFILWVKVVRFWSSFFLTCIEFPKESKYDISNFLGALDYVISMPMGDNSKHLGHLLFNIYIEYNTLVVQVILGSTFDPSYFI